MAFDEGPLDRLGEMFELQGVLQADAYGKHPSFIDNDEERTQFIKDMILALSDELHEALAEVGWKPWATSRHLNTESFHGELVDAWHFFMNLCLVSGLTPDLLYQKYIEKRQRNIQRQQDGYDGVEGKCSNCKRDFTDLAEASGKSLYETYIQLNSGTILCIDCYQDVTNG